MSLVKEKGLIAPQGKWRVVGVDTFEGPTADYLIADVDTYEEAQKLADEHGGIMNVVYVYDDKSYGYPIYKRGSF